MNNRRKKILQELGLTPIWKKRTDSTPESLTSESRETTSATMKDLPASASEVTCDHPVHSMNWDQLKLTVSNCTACALCETRKNTVFGVGDEQADWLFVGEGPGAREDEIGEPFVGQAGKLLDQMLTAIGLKRGSNVYIANIVKCRPPNNRNPSDTEASACEPFLNRQIQLIAPKLIVALGKVSAGNLLNRNDSLSSMRGKVHEYSGIPLIVTYHPAYLLRALPDKAKAWKDLCFAKATMESLL
ncbi:DNA polymerase [Nitrosomonas sp. PY1]|uniref:uracil-DNA glycosylase n=1 Tax=Nitrosomonas sp. PY1 TaxID=1803906 RepID=UPI001FC8CE9B|nr:uracil-DNA glycosylase [Nitrosomonas sp. PY1]GKS68390.1 DNA polymerase [Nitrosomonas sp. PY1]